MLAGCLLCTVVHAAAVDAHAATLDRRLAVQARLDTSSGAPASGTCDLTVRLFAAETGGSALFTQPLPGTVVAGGSSTPTSGPSRPASWRAPPPCGSRCRSRGTSWPRRPLRATAYALVAQQASVALSAADLACPGCVSAPEVAFAYAAAASKGGAASDLDCTAYVR